MSKALGIFKKEVSLKIKLISMLIAVSFIFTGCSIPSIKKLRSSSPNEKFTVAASIECLYAEGIEHVSSYIGLSEPKFEWYLDRSRSYAWFRQPLTLIELHAIKAKETVVTRKQTASAETFGQGNDLIEYLHSNPCD